MVSTRSQTRVEADDRETKPTTAAPAAPTKKPPTKKPSTTEKPTRKSPSTSPKTTRKRKPSTPQPNEGKKLKTTPSTATANTTNGLTFPDRIAPLLTLMPHAPLTTLPLPSPTTPNPQTVLAHLLHALLASARISHAIANDALTRLVDAGYADFATLRASSWDERTELLTQAGYTRYREKTATGLGDLALWLEERYAGDASKLLGLEDGKGEHGPYGIYDGSAEAARERRAAVAKRLREIKGMGDLGLDIFFGTVQGVWCPGAPVVEKRNVDTAGKLGFILGRDVWSLWEAVGRDADTMARLDGAFTVIRLEGRVDEFKRG